MEHPTSPLWLIVEDEPADRLAIERAVGAAALDVRLAFVDDGRSALAYLDLVDELPALVMLDLRLPDLPGTDVLAEIRENERTTGLPVLVLSGSRDRALVDTAYTNGANAYFAKVDTHEALTELVDTIFHHWHQFAELPS